eukprot:5899288-Prymnesium_polylepis.1
MGNHRAIKWATNGPISARGPRAPCAALGVSSSSARWTLSETTEVEVVSAASGTEGGGGGGGGAAAGAGAEGG